MSGAAPVRVLFDCRMASWTGIGRYTRDLVEALGRIEDIALVQLLAPGSEPIGDCAESHVAEGHPFSVRGGREFGRLALRLAPEVVHCPHFPTPLPLAHPLVVTIHDFIPLTVPGVMPSRVKRAVYRTRLGRAVRGADRLITLSRYTAEVTESFHPGSLAKTTVVPAAADDFSRGHIGPLPASVASVGRYVFALGTTRPHKRLDTLLRAWAAAESSIPDEAWLVLSGDEPDGFVAASLGGHPAPARVLWTGRIEDDTLRSLYANADAFVFPSSHEGFGLPPLEAMALGSPVICSNATSLPEVVGDAALMVPVADEGELGGAIIRVLSDRTLAAGLKARGGERAAQFSWSRSARRTADVYRALARQ